MTWIHKLSQANIAFNIYKLKNEDSLILSPFFNTDKILIIIHGIIHVTYIYSHQKLITLTILFPGHTLSNIEKEYHIKSCYKYTAINTTYIISFSKKKLIKYKKKPSLSIDILNTYNLTITQSTIMKQIFIEKEIKYRLLKFIIFLFTQFGIIQQKYIYLPFHIKQKKLAIILGTNKMTVNRILQELSNQLLIKYTNTKTIYITNIYLFRYYCYLLR